MSIHHTESCPLGQLRAHVQDAWATEVVPTLPPDLDDHAHALNAFQRVRGIRCASDLLRALLAVVVLGMSVRHWGAWAVLIGLADISEAAWRKHLVRSRDWLAWLLTATLRHPKPPVLPTSVGTRRVLLVDATRLAQTGGTGDDWRIHTAYDLTVAGLADVVVTDHTQGEHLDHFALQAGDIVVADGGYGYRRNVAAARRQHADVVLRIHPATCPVEDAPGTPIDLIAWLRTPGLGDTRQRRAYCWYAGQRSAVRVVAHWLPRSAARAARRRKWTQARKNGRQITRATLIVAGWVVLITTLPAAQWAAADVLQLYRARWQAEILYKRFKQVRDAHTIRSRTAAAAEATVRALLLAWVLQERTSGELQDLLARIQDAATTAEPVAADTPVWLSGWRVAMLSVSTLRQQVEGTWTAARVRACLPRLMRFLCTRRRRQQQETAMRRWLADQMAQTAQPRCAAA
jgi:hypothetical protein